MSDQSKNIDKDETELRHTLTDRLKELVNGNGGETAFLGKLNDNDSKKTEIKTLKNWQRPETDIQLYNLYLIAIAGKVSVDWLLGLSSEKHRSEKKYKRPTTYGDVLFILNRLFKMGTIGIGDSNHWLLDTDIYTAEGITLPKYIQIKDMHLIELLQALNHAKNMSKKNFKKEWKQTLKQQMDIPIQQYGDTPDYDECKAKRSNENKTDDSTKALTQDALAAIVKDQLYTLQNGMSYREFGKKIGIDKPSTVSGWFQSKTHLPTSHHLYKIAKVYDIDADWILGLNQSEDTGIPLDNEDYTYGRVLLILKHLTEKGTIGFVEAYSPFYEDTDNYGNNKKIPVIDDLFAIDDRFLFCLLLQQEILERYSTAAFKELSEELINKYKDFPLLPFNKDMRYDSDKILYSLWNGKIDQDIDLDKLYKELQAISSSKLDT